MIEALAPYPDMKDSGVSWLGAVPAHWDVAPIARIGRLFKGIGGSKEDEVEAGVPCVRYGDLYTNHEFFIERSRGFLSADRADSYTRIMPGDVLFAASGETIEDIGRSAVNLIEGEVRCGGDVIVLRPHDDAEPRYLGYALDSPASREQKARMGRGFTVVHIYASELNSLMLPVPTFSEQAAIVHFLGHADRQIRRYIAAKQKMIKLLEEQRQTIIHRAVTRGLDPSVPLKPSGAEWLGNVPEHWELMRLKTLCTMKSGDGITADSIERTGLFPVYGGNGIRGFTSRFTHDGDFVLVGRQGALCGNVHIARGQFWASEHAVVVRPDATRATLEWLSHMLGVMNLRQYSLAAAQPGLAVERVLQLRVPSPPMSEQTEIVAYIAGETRTLGNLVETARREIELLRE